MADKPECRVLQVYGNLGLSGAETWLLALLKYFKENEEALPIKLSIHVFLANGFKSDLDEEAEELGATLHYSRYTRSNVLGFIRDWRKVLRKYDFHVIHDHQENTAGLHFLMGLGSLPEVRIAHLHNSLIHLNVYSSSILRKLTLRFGKWLIAKLGTHILATSKQLMEEQGYLAPMYKRLVRDTVYCGFDTNMFSGDHLQQHNSLCQEFNWPKNSKIILFVGRLHTHEKNPEFALEVGRICATRDSRVRFLMIGGGEPVLSLLKERVRQWGMQDKIRLVGQRRDVPRCMLGSHLFLLPSLAEGLGMVVVEAQSAGLPSIVSDTTPRECSVDRSMVQFMSLNDGAEAWANRALDIINLPRPMVAYGNAAVQGSGFSIGNSASKLMLYYTEHIDISTPAPE